jgi:glycosyltransferase involved in cell wall biosynthesis
MVAPVVVAATAGDVERSASNRTKVAHVVLTLSPGGLERLVCDLSVSSKTAGLDVVVACLDTDGTLADALRREDVPVHLIRRRPGLDPGLLLRLARFLRDEHVTVVHTHGPDPMFYGGWAAWLARIPVRIHTQHDTMLEDGSWREHLKFRLAALAFHDVVAVSGKTFEMLEKHRIGRCRLRAIPNGIDEKRFAATERPGGVSVLPGERREMVIGTVARLAPEKALDRLIDAFAVLRQVRPRTHLTIVGDGPERQRLEAQADRLKLGPAVTFLGHQNNVAHVVRQFDMFVLPSITEGIPLALLEAMAAGLPAIATAVGGVPEVVTDDTGVLVPSGDPRALLEAMVDLVDHPEKRLRLGASAAARVRRQFSLTRMSAAYRALYRGVDATRWWVRPIRRTLSAALPRTLIAWRGPTDRPVVALTLDDGPDPVYTPKILDVLRARGVRATFFLVGAKADRHPELVSRIVEEGHHLGNHSYRHPRFGTLSWRTARQEIVDTRRALGAWEPGAPRLFRPPHGTLCAASTLVPWLHGETVVLWNVDFKDFRAESAVDITEQLTRRTFTGGDIILYHGHTPAALEALPSVLSAALDQGMTFVPAARMCQR